MPSRQRNCLRAFTAQVANRRFLVAFASRFVSQQFVFSIAAVAIICAKLVHVYAHLAALGLGEVLRWGQSFFFQDTLLLLVLRQLLDRQLFVTLRWLRILAKTVGCTVSLFALVVGTINMSFYAVAGTEVHWRNIGFVGDKASRKVLLTGLFSSVITGLTILGVSWVLQDLCYFIAGVALRVAKSPVVFVLRKIPITKRFVQPAPSTAEYDHVPQHEDQGVDLDDEPKDEPEPELAAPLSGFRGKVYLFVVGSVLFIQLTTYLFQPDEASLVFMSWTLPLLPWIDFAHSSPSLAGLLPFRGNGINRQWDGRSGLANPIHWSWLPEEKLAGFEDWYEPSKLHYSAADDPLKISNVDDGLLPELHDKLAGIDIRHVVLLKLESTRKDVFPLKKDGYIYKKLSTSFGESHMPEAAHERMATLTPNANFLTGEFDDGFHHNSTVGRGGISFSNAFTTATYTMKSMTGTLCGITPLLADFNIEFLNHIYQPCLPQIFNAFNEINRSIDIDPSDFRTFKWRSTWLQSVTGMFDKQLDQMPSLGYAKENFVYKEYLKGEADRKPKFGPVTLPEINYFGMAEVAIEDYIKDAFAMAKKDNERVFLTHLTSTAHHPFEMPEEEEYVSLTEDGRLDSLSHYVNAVGYIDRWIGKILGMLEEQGVANETLVILVGDHGLSIAEDGGNTPYHNTNIGCFQIPLVLSHPMLPQININTAVQSLQVLPTILDLLRETGSLSETVGKAADDLARNYEGQSLIRPLRISNPATHLADWEFTVMNPGRAMIAVRNTQVPDWRLTVPVVENFKWRFTDLKLDPHETKPVYSFGFFSFLRRVEEVHSTQAAEWCEEAAFVTRWWVEDNRKRYRYQADRVQIN